MLRGLFTYLRLPKAAVSDHFRGPSSETPFCSLSVCPAFYTRPMSLAPRLQVVLPYTQGTSRLARGTRDTSSPQHD